MMLFFAQKSRLELFQVRFINNSAQNSLQLKKKSYSVQVYQFLRKYICVSKLSEISQTERQCSMMSCTFMCNLKNKANK